MYVTERTLSIVLILIAIVLVVFLFGCSEERYCEQPYVLYYNPITLHDGSIGYEPVMGCNDESTS